MIRRHPIYLLGGGRCLVRRGGPDTALYSPVRCSLPSANVGSTDRSQDLHTVRMRLVRRLQDGRPEGCQGEAATELPTAAPCWRSACARHEKTRPGQSRAYGGQEKLLQKQDHGRIHGPLFYGVAGQRLPVSPPTTQTLVWLTTRYYERPHMWMERTLWRRPQWCLNARRSLRDQTCPTNGVCPNRRGGQYQTGFCTIFHTAHRSGGYSNLGHHRMPDYAHMMYGSIPLPCFPCCLPAK